MKRHPHFLVALFLVTIYSVIIMGPLAPLFTRSPAVVHAMTGECAGDCDICGCSPERRANHSCCCWQKKLKHAHEREKVPECCKKKRHKMTMLTCNCPCGGNNQDGIWDSEKSEHLPYLFSEGVIVNSGDTLFTANTDHLTARHADPPDPPPKLA